MTARVLSRADATLLALPFAAWPRRLYDNEDSLNLSAKRWSAPCGREPFGIMEERQGRPTCCPEERAWRQGCIDDTGVSAQPNPLRTRIMGNIV